MTLSSRLRASLNQPDPEAGTLLGYTVQHGRYRTDQPVAIANTRRPEHVAILGKTGTGKTSLLRLLCEQDIRADRGFVFFDIHGDATPVLTQVVAEEEQRRGEDLARKFIVIDPADPEYSAGINILEAESEHQRYVQLAEVTQILRDRWKLEAFGARTEELLRNSLQVLQDTGLTFIDLGPLLINPAFRANCLRRVRSPEARAYFTNRYGRLSEAAQTIYREAVLNKITVFSGDPHFRHLLGQSNPSVRFQDVVDHGYWLILNLNKGLLGEQAVTLGSLLLSQLKHTLFARASRDLFTVFADELQNLVALDGGLDSLFAETRKLGVSVVSANQYLDQYPEGMQAAILAVGTLAFFQLSGLDAPRIARALGGDSHLAWQLRNLPSRQMIVKRYAQSLVQAGVPEVRSLSVDATDLKKRSNFLWTERREHIEDAITTRMQIRNDLLDDWG